MPEPLVLSEEFRVASETMRARSVDALPKLESVFQNNEPSVTNWAGEFQGYKLDIITPLEYMNKCVALFKIY